MNIHILPLNSPLKQIIRSLVPVFVLQTTPRPPGERVRGATGVELHVFICMLKCSLLADVGSVYHACRVSLNYKTLACSVTGPARGPAFTWSHNSAASDSVHRCVQLIGDVLQSHSLLITRPSLGGRNKCCNSIRPPVPCLRFLEIERNF